ncbi:MAG TPA: hypothetical protein VGZ91_13985 [Candidatus Sulfotelmatobacter sp.]|jgi:hypothetical protein|nr:hypothetical protein [Candidatus Sulfotelmatobacter sp.]
MLLPFMMFALGSIVFALLGVIVLVYLPTFRLTVKNVSVFVVGAFPGALAVGYLYGRAFADGRNELNGTVAVVGSFAVMLIGATISGTTFVWLKVRGVGRR